MYLKELFVAYIAFEECMVVACSVAAVLPSLLVTSVT